MLPPRRPVAVMHRDRVSKHGGTYPWQQASRSVPQPYQSNETDDGPGALKQDKPVLAFQHRDGGEQAPTNQVEELINERSSAHAAQLAGREGKQDEERSDHGGDLTGHECPRGRRLRWGAGDYLVWFSTSASLASMLTRSCRMSSRSRPNRLMYTFA